MSLSPECRQALGEYVIREQRKGRKEMTAGEVKIAVRAIQATLGEPEFVPNDNED